MAGGPAAACDRVDCSRRPGALSNRKGRRLKRVSRVGVAIVLRTDLCQRSARSGRKVHRGRTRACGLLGVRRALVRGMADGGPIDGCYPALSLAIILDNAFRTKLIRLALVVLVIGVQSEGQAL